MKHEYDICLKLNDCGVSFVEIGFISEATTVFKAALVGLKEIFSVDGGDVSTSSLSKTTMKIGLRQILAESLRHLQEAQVIVCSTESHVNAPLGEESRVRPVRLDLIHHHDWISVVGPDLRCEIHTAMILYNLGLCYLHTTQHEGYSLQSETMKQNAIKILALSNSILENLFNIVNDDVSIGVIANRLVFVLTTLRNAIGSTSSPEDVAKIDMRRAILTSHFCKNDSQKSSPRVKSAPAA
jgi:hypothetical protein